MVKFHTTIASSFIDPGHLGVSFDALLPFPLLMIGGYYPLSVPMKTMKSMIFKSKNSKIGANGKEHVNGFHSVYGQFDGKQELNLFLHQIQSWVKVKQPFHEDEEHENLLHRIHDFMECKLESIDEEQSDIDDDDSDIREEHKTQQSEDNESFALNMAMNQLFVCTPRSSILDFPETQRAKDTIAQLHCGIFAALLRHTGIISKMASYVLELQSRRGKAGNGTDNTFTNKARSRAKSLGMVPREIQILWERARVAVNSILEAVPNEQELVSTKKRISDRIELLMKVSPAWLHIKEICGVFDASKLISYPQGYLTPIQKQTPWICNHCFHYNGASQFHCQICEAGKRHNATSGINVRFTWDPKMFTSEELYASFQSVCQVETIIRSQRGGNQNQNGHQTPPVKKLVKQIIAFIAENKTPTTTFYKLLTMQSTLGLFRIKGLHIIHETMSKLSFPDHIAQFAEHLSALMTLSNVESMSMTQNLNLTESKVIERCAAVSSNLKLSSIQSGGFAHILSNIEYCGCAISSEIMQLSHSIIHFLFEQSSKCQDHQQGFTTPLFHLMGTLIRPQDLEFIASSRILSYLKQFFSFKSLSDLNPFHISFQQRFAAWTAFRSLIYSTSFPMFSSLPTVTVDHVIKMNAAHNIVSNVSPSSQCAMLFTDKTRNSRSEVFRSILRVIVGELRLLLKAQSNHPLNQLDKKALSDILEKFHHRPQDPGNSEGSKVKEQNQKKTKWSCSLCTFVNAPEDDTCSMCLRGVRPMTGNQDNELRDEITWMCRHCGCSNTPDIPYCAQCTKSYDHTPNAPNPKGTDSILPELEQMNIMKWIEAQRNQSICNVDVQYLYLLQKEIGWLHSKRQNASTCSTDEVKVDGSNEVENVCDANSKGSSLTSTPRPNPGPNPNPNHNPNSGPNSNGSESIFNFKEAVSSKDCDLDSSDFHSLFNDHSERKTVHILAASFGINQLLWVLLRCCACNEFLSMIQKNKSILNMLMKIVGNSCTSSNLSKSSSQASACTNIQNVSSVSKKLAIKLLIWILPTMKPETVEKCIKGGFSSFLESILKDIGESDYQSWDSLSECRLEKEAERIHNDISLQLLYLIRVLFQNRNWTAIIENMCFRILALPFNKSEDVTMDSPTPKSFVSKQSGSGSDSLLNVSGTMSPLCSDKASMTTSENDNDDEKFELEHISELVPTVGTATLSPARSTTNLQHGLKRKLSFESNFDEKSDAECESVHSNSSFIKSKSDPFWSMVNENVSLRNMCRNLGDKQDDDSGNIFNKMLKQIIGILCVMGEYVCSLHEGVRIRVRHRDKEFTGTIVSIKYMNLADPTGDFTETQILCDNGLTLNVNMTNKRQFEISMLDHTSFNPLKLQRPKYLILLLRDYIHETFLSPQSTSPFCKTILRRVMSVIRQFSRYNEFSLMMQHFGLIKDLVAVSLTPVRYFEDEFDSTLDDQNIWKTVSETRDIAEWKKNLKVGSIIDCQDRLSKWFESEIVQFNYDKKEMLIHYCEWSSKWDEWISLDDDRIAPWRTHTDGSFKNRGYNPLNPSEHDLLALKLRNPSDNIKVLQKCMLGLRKFHKSAETEESDEPVTPISIDSDIEIGEQRTRKLQRKSRDSPYNRLHRAVRADSDEFDDFDDDDDPTEDETESADSEEGPHAMSAESGCDSIDTVQSSLKLKRHKDNNAGVPCPNHVFLPNGINKVIHRLWN